jgi:Arc/MetJ-type ribon-helix-helix transcriptional regulator
MASKKSQAISITINPDLINWIDEKISIHKFANRSHAINYCLKYVITHEKKDFIDE